MWIVITVAFFIIFSFINKTFIGYDFKKRVEYLTYINSFINAISCSFLWWFLYYKKLEPADSYFKDLEYLIKVDS